MSDPNRHLSLACWDYDRAQALLDGRIEVPGCNLECQAMPPSTLFPLAVGEARFDVTEMSLSSYLMQVSTETCAYTAIPVFLSRAFRHGGIFIRADAGIREPTDLEGHAVGVPEYQMTAALWMRGILSDEYGVDISRLIYRTGVLDGGARTERLPLDLPPEFDVQPISEGSNLNDLLLGGEIDAILAPKPPRAHLEGDPRVRRLFENYEEHERAYYRNTGFFPIMHLVGIRTSLLEEHPWLAERLLNAFTAARDLAMKRLEEVCLGSANRLSLPWLHADFEETRALMGPNYWPYGVPANRAELEWLCKQSFAQHLAARPLAVEELFHPSVLD